MYPQTINNVFDSIVPSVASARKEIGTTKTKAAIVMILTEMAMMYNTGANLNQEQVIELTNDIVEYYYYLKFDDLKLCFKNAQRGIYGDIYRIDAAVILTWLEKYSNDRLNMADEISYNSHVSTKDESRGEIKVAANIYKKFKA